MGATIICKKAAQAFVANDGVVRYVLFEKTYEQNVFPHTPHWGAVAVGTFDEVMEEVVRFSSVLPGGMIRSKQRPILPENYIAHWRQLIAKPLSVLSTKASLFWGDTYTFLNDTDEKRLKSLQNVIDSLSEQSSAKWKEALQNLRTKFISLDINDDVEVVLALIRHKAVPAWRIFSDSRPDERKPFVMPTEWAHIRREQVEATQPQPPDKASVEVKLPIAASLGFDRFNSQIVSMDGKTWSNPRPDYSHESDFIAGLLKDAELAQPGISKRVLPEFRTILASAKKLDDSTKVRVMPHATAGLSSYAVECTQRFIKRLGAADGQPVIEFTLGDVRSLGPEAQYEFGCISQQQIVWPEMRYCGDNSAELRP